MKNGIKFELNKNQQKSIRNYINSEYFKNKKDDNYSAYWEEESKLLRFSFTGSNEISITGSSGFYVPSNKYSNLIKKLINIYSYRRKIIYKIKSLFSSYFSKPKFMSYKNGFNAVMANKPISDPDLSDYRFNHVKNSIKFKNIIQNYQGIFKHYKEMTSINLSHSQNQSHKYLN